MILASLGSVVETEVTIKKWGLIIEQGDDAVYLTFKELEQLQELTK